MECQSGELEARNCSWSSWEVAENAGSEVKGQREGVNPFEQWPMCEMDRDEGTAEEGLEGQEVDGSRRGVRSEANPPGRRWRTQRAKAEGATEGSRGG